MIMTSIFNEKDILNRNNSVKNNSNFLKNNHWKSAVWHTQGSFILYQSEIKEIQT